MTDTLAAPIAAAPPADLLHGASLFLDFDGTLVELAARPEAVVVGAHVGALLRRLADRLGGRLAIVTGRPAAHIADRFPGLPLTISGSHGAELRRPGEAAADPVPPAWIAAAAARGEALRADHPGVLVEAKPFGIGLHYREAPDAAAAVHALAEQIAGDTLVVQPGKMIVEVREPGHDKGTAVAALMATPALAGTTPVFIGDDLTDESAFAAAAALGGAGILVGPPRDTAARFRLADVAATLAWLDTASEELP